MKTVSKFLSIFIVVVLVFISCIFIAKIRVNAAETDFNKKTKGNRDKFIQSLCKVTKTDPKRTFKTSQKLTDKFWKVELLKETSDDGDEIQTDYSDKFINYLNRSAINKLNKENIQDIEKTKYDNLFKIAENTANELCSEKMKFTKFYHACDNSASFQWKRVIGDYIYETDSITVYLNPDNAEILAISRNMLSDVPEINLKVSKETSMNLAKDIYKNEKKVSSVTVKNCELVIANLIYDGKATSFNKKSRLSYKVFVKCNDAEDNTTVILIDAETGKSNGEYTIRGK